MRIARKKSTEQFSVIPYLMMLNKCLYYVWYGLPWVSTDNIELTVIYGIGVVISSVYIWIFRKFAPNGEKAKILRYLILMVVVFFIMVLVTIFVPSKRKSISGFTAIIVSMLMSASPLLIMRMVIASKSVEFMPFFLSLLVFFCSTFSFVSGIFCSDPFLVVPNVIGCALGAVQLLLYAMHCEKIPSVDCVEWLDGWKQCFEVCGEACMQQRGPSSLPLYTQVGRSNLEDDWTFPPRFL